MIDRYLRQADVANLSFPLKRLQDAELLVLGYGGIDTVQLIQIDALEFEPTKTAFEFRPKMLRAAVGSPLARAGTFEAALGPDDEFRRVRRQGLGNQRFADVGAGPVGRVDEGDAQIHGAAQDAKRFGPILGRSPYARSGDAHRAKAEAMDSEVAERDGTAERGGLAGSGTGSGSHYSITSSCTGIARLLPRPG